MKQTNICRLSGDIIINCLLISKLPYSSIITISPHTRMLALAELQRHFASRHTMRVSGSDGYALLFLYAYVSFRRLATEPRLAVCSLDFGQPAAMLTKPAIVLLPEFRPIHRSLRLYLPSP